MLKIKLIVLLAEENILWAPRGLLWLPKLSERNGNYIDINKHRGGRLTIQYNEACLKEGAPFRSTKYANLWDLTKFMCILL